MEIEMNESPRTQAQAIEETPDPNKNQDYATAHKAARILAKSLPPIQELLTLLLQKSPSSPVSASAGRLCVALGLHRNAREFFHQAIVLDRRNIPLYNELGLLELQLNQYAAAEACFYAVIEEDPRNREARRHLGGLYEVAPQLAEDHPSRQVQCPCCHGHFPRFLPKGIRLRPYAQCPRCGSLERHRLVWLYVVRRTRLCGDSMGTRFLHVAPEAVLEAAFRRIPRLDYVSADLDPSRAMVQMDITNIHFEDNRFDAILCSHVLEHIPDDLTAMRELNRVLKPGGWAILQVPIDRGRTASFEDPSVRTPEERERVFGQHDHVRIYGLDYRDRLEEAGFCVSVDPFAQQLGLEKCRRYGLDSKEEIYFCTKEDLRELSTDARE
jgi:predicted SAM-dependent methyltransferase